MKIIISFFILFITSTIVFAGGTTSAFYHEIPIGIIQGETAHLELTVNNFTFSGSDFIDVRVFYRELGKEQFKSKIMKEEGYAFYADLNTSKLNTNQVEYYFAYRNKRGGVRTIPSENPEMNPYVMNVTPAVTQEQATGFEVVVLSPDLNEIIPNDEIIIAASVLGGETDIDFDQSRLLIDGVNVTAAADFSNGIITFAPRSLRTGRHNVELQLVNNDGELLQNKEWAFRAIESSAASAKMNYRGSVFVDNRSQNISDINDNFFRGGGYFAGNYKNLDFYTRLVFSSEESEDIQPVNRYTAELKYNFSEFNNLYLKGGDFVPYYNPLTFQDKRVRGVQTGIAYGLFTFDYVYGQTTRGIEGQDSLTTVAGVHTSQVNGIYSESISAYRPGFRFGRNVHWNLNLINSKEDEESIDYGGNVKEALVIGTDLSMNFDNRRVMFEGSFQASMQNTNAGGPEVESLADIDSSLADNSAAESAFDFLKSTGFLSVTPGLSPLPSLAMQFDLYLRYFKNNLKFTYLSVNRDYASPGNPYLLKDRKGFYIFDNIRLFQNQVFLNVFFKSYKNNLTDDHYSTSNSEVGTTVSYFPVGNYPSLTLGYTSYSRSNGVTAAEVDSMPYLYVEDNSTQQINFATSYELNFNNIRNTLLFNVSNFARDDIGNKETNSSFNSFTIGVRSKFDFPLTTKLSFSQSGTEIGDTLLFTTDVSRFNLNADYKFHDVFDSDVLKPFINVSFQTIDGGAGTTSTNRNNYATGIVYQSSIYGIFSLKYYQVSYKNLVTNKNIDDTIINARYEYLF